MTQIKVLLSLIIFFCFHQQGWAQQCQMSFDDKTGLFTIKSNSVDLVKANYVFWETNWGWADTKSVSTINGLKTYSTNATVEKLGLNITSVTKVSEPNQLNWDYTLSAQREINDVIGGGIAFIIDPGDQNDVNVELLPDNTGWIMDGQNGCKNVTVRFSEPVKNIYFEGRNKHHIRAFFYEKKILTETAQNRMSVTLPYDAEVIGTISEQLGGQAGITWHRDMLHPFYSPVDLSFMNENEIPAGKHGFLKASGEDLQFEDGTKARFWGTNIQAYTLFATSPSQMKTHAKRLSQLGFNLVRFHHHDSGWVNPNIFGNKAPDTKRLDRESLKLLDLWIKALKDEGIYIWLDLNVGREFTDKDGIENFAEIAKGRNITPAKGFNYIDDDVEALMKEFNEAYLNHVNEYTGLAYKDDPAIINVLLTNENDLTHHFGNALLPDKNVPVSNKKYMQLAEQFANDNDLSTNQTWRSWEPGPSKIFLNDLERSYNQRMINHLRSVGLKSGISTTNSWGAMPLSSLPALTTSDIIDVHSYGRNNFFKSNPRYKDNFISWIGAAQVIGKPLSVSEWNVERFPDTFDRFSSPVYLAAISALQGWDALMQYGYSQQPLNNEGRPSNYSTFNDPASMALMPAAALIYRQNHVSEAENTYSLSLTKEQFFGKRIDPSNAASIRTVIEQSKLLIKMPTVPELTWLDQAPSPEDGIEILNPDKDFIPEGQNFVQSDTRELTRDWNEGIYTINTAKSQIAMGWIGGKIIILDNIEVDLLNKNAAVAVQSLDNNPIASSDKILISFATRTEPSQGNNMPYLSEPLNGSMSIKAKEGLNLYLLNKYGKKLDHPVNYSNGSYHLALDRTVKSYWLVLEKKMGTEIAGNQ